MRKIHRVLLLVVASLAYCQSIPTGPVDVRLQVDDDLNDVRASANVPAMRGFAWRAFHTITRAVPSAPRIPIWMSWCTRQDVLRCKCPEPGGGFPQIRTLSFSDEAKPGRAQGTGFDVLSSIYYNPSTARYLSTQKMADGPLVSGYRKQLLALATTYDTQGVGPAKRDIPPLPLGSIVVKPAWIIVKHPNRVPIAKIPVWDGLDAQLNKSRIAHHDLITMDRFSRTVILNFHGISPRRDCSTKPEYPQEEPDDTLSLAGHFFFYQVCSFDTFATADAQKVCNGLTEDKCTLQDGDILVLAGLHVITHQVDDWTWSTFWWHDQPVYGRFALGRPPELAADSIWRNYLMDVTFDEDTPRNSDGSSRAIFNPYLEAQIENGYRSNCMSCHRLAAVHCSNRGKCDNLNYQDPYQVRIPGEEPFAVPLHGTDPAHALFDGAVRTGFLWSIADRGGNVGCSTY